MENMEEKFNSRKWVAFFWFMSLSTVSLVVVVVLSLIDRAIPNDIVKILTMTGCVTGGYCGFNVLNKKVTGGSQNGVG